MKMLNGMHQASIVIFMKIAPAGHAIIFGWNTLENIDNRVANSKMKMLLYAERPLLTFNSSVTCTNLTLKDIGSKRN